MLSHPENLGSTCSDRCAKPAQQSTTMVDDVARVCAAHPRASPTSWSWLCRLSFETSEVGAGVMTGSRRVAEWTERSCEDKE